MFKVCVKVPYVKDMFTVDDVTEMTGSSWTLDVDSFTGAYPDTSGLPPFSLKAEVTAHTVTVGRRLMLG